MGIQLTQRLFSLLLRFTPPSSHLPSPRFLHQLQHQCPRSFHPRLALPTHRPYSSQRPETKRYSFDEIQSLITHPNSSPSHLLIDVREPAELASTGRIPGAVSMPLTSNPDSVYLSEEDFRDRFGFEKPGSDIKEGGGGVADLEPETTATAGHGGADPSADLGAGNYAGGGEDEADEGREGAKEVIFYCKAGVRSRAAAQMAAGEEGWKGVRVGEMGGGWDEWVGRGGKVER